MSSANAFISDQSKILSSGNRLIRRVRENDSIDESEGRIRVTAFFYFSKAFFETKRGWVCTVLVKFPEVIERYIRVIYQWLVINPPSNPVCNINQGDIPFNLTFSQTSHGLLRVFCTSLLKTLWEKEKLLVTSNFSFSHSVFYPFEELSCIFIKFGIVVCKLFQFGRI